MFYIALRSVKGQIAYSFISGTYGYVNIQKSVTFLQRNMRPVKRFYLDSVLRF